jgi:Tol biopolymer transport system component
VNQDDPASSVANPDINLWSLPADTRTGKVTGTLRRITRGAGITAYSSLSSDGRAVAFASDRNGNWDVILKDLGTGKESVVAGGTDRQMYSVIIRDARAIRFKTDSTS